MTNTTTPDPSVIAFDLAVALRSMESNLAELHEILMLGSHAKHLTKKEWRHSVRELAEAIEIMNEFRTELLPMAVEFLDSSDVDKAIAVTQVISYIKDALIEAAAAEAEEPEDAPEEAEMLSFDLSNPDSEGDFFSFLRKLTSGADLG